MFAKVMIADLCVSQSKLRTGTHTLSREPDEVIAGCEKCFILIAGLEGLVKHCDTISVRLCTLNLVLCVSVVVVICGNK